MTNTSGSDIPFWGEPARQACSYPPLLADVSADVCVVGAGIAGLSTAYLLTREGKSVIVLDHGHVGSGETGRTTAHLSNALDDRYCELERLHGRERARLAAESHTAAIDAIEAFIETENIQCDFERVDGFLFLPPMADPEPLEEEEQAAQRAGVAVEWACRAPIESFDTGRCLRFPQQGQLHPLKYVRGLAQAIERWGGRIFAATHVQDVQAGAPVIVRTAHGPEVRAQAVVIATNAPVGEAYGHYTTSVTYRTYAIAIRVPRGSVTRALYWDTADPYHYVRLQRNEADSSADFLIVGGEDHKTGQADDLKERFESLEAWTRDRFQQTGLVDFRWSGQVIEPVDGLASIGPHPLAGKNIYIASGDSGHGMTHGTIAGMVLKDLILEHENRWAGLYDPSRITLRAFSAMAGNTAVGAQLTGSGKDKDADPVGPIAPGHGATIQSGWTNLAVYRDEYGEYHRRSAVCPHLGGIVSWNSREKTWNCPRHGSRFDPFGNVIRGPANSNLDTPESHKALLQAAALLMESSASLSTNFLGKLLGLGIRMR